MSRDVCALSSWRDVGPLVVSFDDSLEFRGNYSATSNNRTTDHYTAIQL